MSRSRRWSLGWIVASLVCAGCSGSTVTVPPQPSSSTGPIAYGRGTLAVINVAEAQKRVWIFPPQSNQFTREILFPAGFEPNSLAFDRRSHLYIGANRTGSPGAYVVVEVNVPNSDIVREIHGLPQWSNSSVAVDDENNLYVNTKSFIGGDVKVFRPNTDTKPYIEIKDHHSPLTTLVTSNALWVGFEGAFSDALARYRLRSTERTWFQTIGSSLPVTLAVNADGSLIAGYVKRDSTRAVDVFDVKSGNKARTLIESKNILAMAGDNSGHVYVSESQPGRINACNFRGCTFSFDTSGRPVALAVSPVDGTVYVSNTGKKNVQQFDPQTGNNIMAISLPNFDPKELAIEP